MRISKILQCTPHGYMIFAHTLRALQHTQELKYSLATTTTRFGLVECLPLIPFKASEVLRTSAGFDSAYLGSTHTHTSHTLLSELTSKHLTETVLYARVDILKPWCTSLLKAIVCRVRINLSRVYVFAELEFVLELSFFFFFSSAYSLFEIDLNLVDEWFFFLCLRFFKQNR